jgi:hypothetical protein
MNSEGKHPLEHGNTANQKNNFFFVDIIAKEHKNHHYCGFV